ALLLLSDMSMRVFDKQGGQMVTRSGVATTVPSGDFSASTGWTLSTAAGQTTAISGGKLNLTARAHGAKALAQCSITVAGGDQNVEHGLRIVVERGPVTLRLGSTTGDDDLIRTTA